MTGRVTPTKQLLEELTRREKEALDAREDTTLMNLLYLAEKAEVPLTEIGIAYRFALDSSFNDPNKFAGQLGNFKVEVSDYFPFGGQKYFSPNEFANKARAVFSSI